MRAGEFSGRRLIRRIRFIVFQRNEIYMLIPVGLRGSVKVTIFWFAFHIWCFNRFRRKHIMTT